MKKICFLAFLLVGLFIVPVFCQHVCDTILTKDGRTLLVVDIQKTNSKEITYAPCGTSDDVRYVIKMDNVLKINSKLNIVSSKKVATLRKTGIQHLEFFALDASSRSLQVWVLSDVKIEATGLTARFDRASEALAREISSMHGNAAMKRHPNRVLIYVNHSTAKAYGDTLTTHLNDKDIYRIVVFNPKAGKRIQTALMIAGVVVLAGGIAMLIVCNCPHVYAEGTDGASQLQGSLYSGAIYPQLERSDWLPMPQLQPIGNQYHIRLANQESQHQHTNLVALEVLDHAPGLQTVFDKYGQLHTLAAPQAPLAATDVSGKNVLPEVIAADEKIFVGDLENEGPDATERLTLRFIKPAHVQRAKLLLNVKNSDWLDYTYFEFQDALGQYADEVDRKYRRSPAAKNLAWSERQKIPLAVWLETASGHWEKIDYFNLTGASVFRQVVLPLDLTRVPGDVVHLRLEFGFHFWEIDYAALDFSADQPVRQTTLRPLSALDQTGQNVLASLLNDDDRYYDQPNVGDEARIAFEVPPLAPGQERSLVLQAKGHYEVLHPSAPGRPSLFKLKAWEKENALPRLSRERWRAVNRLTLHQ